MIALAAWWMGVTTLAIIRSFVLGMRDSRLSIFMDIHTWDLPRRTIP